MKKLVLPSIKIMVNWPVVVSLVAGIFLVMQKEAPLWAVVLIVFVEWTRSFFMFQMYKMQETYYGTVIDHLNTMIRSMGITEMARDEEKQNER